MDTQCISHSSLVDMHYGIIWLTSFQMVTWYRSLPPCFVFFSILGRMLFCSFYPSLCSALPAQYHPFHIPMYFVALYQWQWVLRCFVGWQLKVLRDMIDSSLLSHAMSSAGKVYRLSVISPLIRVIVCSTQRFVTLYLSTYFLRSSCRFARTSSTRLLRLVKW